MPQNHSPIPEEQQFLLGQAKTHQQIVDHAVRIQGALDNARRHNPGEEVGQVADGLHDALENEMAHFVEHQGERDRRNKSEHQIDRAHDERVPQHEPEAIVVEHECEMLETDPLLLGERFSRLEILERDRSIPRSARTGK